MKQAIKLKLWRKWKMPRISVSKELAEELERIKYSTYAVSTRDRGLESTVTYVLDQYKSMKSVESQIRVLKRDLEGLIERKVEDGLFNAFKKWIQTVISLSKP